jgi:hypothetical protein
MVIQLIPSPDDLAQARAILSDRTFLASAVLDPATPNRVTLDRTVRTHGCAALGTHDLRRNARYLLGKHGTALREVNRVLLARLVIAGFRQPAYEDYTAVPVLCRTDAAVHIATSDVITRIALRTVSDIVGLLGELPQLTDHPERAKLDAKIAIIRDLCGELAFGPAPTDHLDDDEPVVDPVIHGAMLPESGVAEELVFQAVTQSSEVVFAAASILAHRATVRIAHDQAVLAAVDLHHAAVVQQPLIRLLGLLDVMSVESWESFRPAIERPAALQSRHYRALTMLYPEVTRIHDHARYPKHERAHVPWLRQNLDGAISSLDQWRAMHGAIAAKYTPGGSPGLFWLKAQVAPVLEKRRQARSGPATLAETIPPGGGCPMGHGSRVGSPVVAGASVIGY